MTFFPLSYKDRIARCKLAIARKKSELWDKTVAPLYLNSLLQIYVPLEACVLQVNVALLFIPKRHTITFTDFYINCSLLMEWPAHLNPSSWVLKHLQESPKNTSLPSLFDPLTLALSILILFLKKQKNTNTSFSNIYFYIIIQNKKTLLCVLC